ncbi:thioesterase-like superfamily-domain-containing protein [Paraphoma chrysanthemicola]|uniref:Thioesterase-like superfamily-domain-containing protein n=1 Tax=Paraphoma chrysanthemicola TaxID=798071 RepID=A0A8K0R8I8_9PLEO|nr:thioesterase-like superfamily-domain-containing protein [Paraphoma chrysanthemicola]
MMVVRPYFTAQKQVLPFDKVIELETIDDWTFRSIVKAYSPTGGENGTYGGHVFAQAAWAAAQTVEEGYMIHNITGWFILGGKPNEHYTYRVKKIRDGFNYCTRSVTVSQIAAHGDMFTCTCSFKKEEASSVDVQDTLNLRDIYEDVQEGKENEPMEHPAAPSIDSEEFREKYLPAHPEHFNPLAGLHIRKADMAKFNIKRKPLDRRQLLFYTLRGALPLPTAPYPPPPDGSTKLALTREANMHACAHLYASDRNSLFVIPNHLDHTRDFTRMASLSHSVIFHVGIRDLVMTAEPRINHPDADPTLWEGGALPLCNLEGYEKGDKDGRKWFVQEAHLTRASGGRALHTSRLWDYDTGVHIATTFQDGLVRFKGAPKL